MLQGVLDVGIYPWAGGELGSLGIGVNVAARGGAWMLCLVRKGISLAVESPGILTGTGEGKTFPFLQRRARRIESFLRKMLPIPCSPHPAHSKSSPKDSHWQQFGDPKGKKFPLLHKKQLFDLFPCPQCKAATNTGLSHGAGIVIPSCAFTIEPLGRAMHPSFTARLFGN